MVVFEKWDAQTLADILLEKNPEVKTLKQKFVFPNNQIVEYDVNAPVSKWVIKCIDGVKTDRKFGSWPLISGTIK